jgi:hypothetical protein
MKKIKKTMWNMKEEINKVMETLKNNQSKIGNTISLRKISIESFMTEWRTWKTEYQESKT